MLAHQVPRSGSTQRVRPIGVIVLIDIAQPEPVTDLVGASTPRGIVCQVDEAPGPTERDVDAVIWRDAGVRPGLPTQEGAVLDDDESLVLAQIEARTLRGLERVGQKGIVPLQKAL